MAQDSCIIPSAKERLANKTINRLSKEQKQSLGISEGTEEHAVSVIYSIIGASLQAAEPNKRDNMLEDPEGFGKFLEHFMQVEVSEDEYDSVMEEYNFWMEMAKSSLRMFDTSKMTKKEIDDMEADAQASSLIFYDRDPKGQYFKIAIKKPIKTEKPSRQDRTLKAIENIQNLESTWIATEYTDQYGDLKYVHKGERPNEKWKPTGRHKYSYNGKEILATTVSYDVHGDQSDVAFPVMAAPIGTQVDRVGRLFFSKEGIKIYGKNVTIWDKDGNLKEDEFLQEIINSYLEKMFSVQGLKNLIQDFKALQEQLEEEWPGCKVFAGDIRLFGKNEGEWVVGKPDFLVVDSEGIVHTLDLKTAKMTNAEGYFTVLNDQFKSGVEYGKQITRYNRMLQSYGLQVDDTPYVVLVDTWYDSTDKGDKNENPEDKIYDIVELDYKDKDTIETHGLYIAGTEQTLGEYAEEQNNPAVSEAFSDKELLYIEPRLHVKATNDNEHFVMSEELAALRGPKQGVLKDMEAVTYEKQLVLASKEDRNAMEWFAGKIKAMHTAQGTVRLADSDIGSNPELMGEQEIQEVADWMMHMVSKTLDYLSAGSEFEEIPLSIAEEGKSSPLHGKSHLEICRILGNGKPGEGIMKVIDFVFNDRIADRYDPDFSEEWFREECEEAGVEFYEQDFKDAQLQNKKAKWLIDHRSQFIRLGSARLLALEDFLMPVMKEKDSQLLNAASAAEIQIDSEYAKEDEGDNEAVDDFLDKFAEGLTDTEAWMFDQRHHSPRSSLAKEIKRLFEDIVLLDENGEIVYDPYGWELPMFMDGTTATQTILEACKDCEDFEEMLEAMRSLANNPKNRWINELIQRLESNDNLRRKFFRNFRKDALTYSISKVVLDKKTGQKVVVTEVINMKSATQTMLDSLRADFTAGSVGTWEGESLISNKDGKNILTKSSKGGSVAGRIEKAVSALREKGKDLYKKHPGFNGDKKSDEFQDYIAGQLIAEDIKGHSMVKDLTAILHGVGIMVSEDVVLNCLLSKPSRSYTKSNLNILLQFIKRNDNNGYDILSRLSAQNEGLSKNGSIPMGLKGLDAFGPYKDLINKLSGSVQSVVEASVYQDGKTYYSYTNPSRLGHIIRNLKDAMDTYSPLDYENTETKFGRYLERSFGRYRGWFKDIEGENWMNDLLAQLDSDNPAARQALDHKVELTYLGNQYRDLGSLGFMLSILHNYFGTKDDPSNTRWFAMPTMSNKPVNEFVRMLKYGDSMSYKDEIVKRVLLPTFKQEMNRIADVLYHFVTDTVATDQMDLTIKKLKKAGYSPEEIASLKERIRNSAITAEDLVRLGKVTSGAKFHFLWYLNNEIAQSLESDKSMADSIATRVNILLTPNDSKHEERRRQLTNLSDQINLNNTVEQLIRENMQRIEDAEIREMERIGLFATKEIKTGKGDDTRTILRYWEEFDGKIGKEMTRKSMEKDLREFIWQDIAANINIIQITGGDLAYYGNSVNYQKRIAMIHSPGLHMMHDEEIDDGYLRSVHISDHNIMSEIMTNAEVALGRQLATLTNPQERKDFEVMVKFITKGFKEINATDGQSFSSISSMKKKLQLMGEWSDEREEAYNAVASGKFNAYHLGVLMQPTKPLVASEMAKYSGSPTMTLRKTPLQDKNSEYLIILAEALSRSSGNRNKLAAISDFMEATHKFGDGRQGIDTVHFQSVGKVGVSGVIDINHFDEEFNKILALDDQSAYDGDCKDVFGTKGGKVTEADYNSLLKEFLMKHIRKGDSAKPHMKGQDLLEEARLKSEGLLSAGETVYNMQYVDTIPVDDYIIQQEVPAHLLDHEQLYGSQIRILGISDITPSTKGHETIFEVRGEKMTAEELIDEYKSLHAENIEASFNDLMIELGLDQIVKMDDGKKVRVSLPDMDKMSPADRDSVFKKVAFMLQKELAKDAKYGIDMMRSCSLEYNMDTVIDFNVPLMDPIQSKRIQMLINSVIKKTINKQKIKGGPVVQTTAYDKNLHIKFKGKDGRILPTFSEYGKSIEEYEKFLKDNQAGIAYFECYLSIPNAELERLLVKPDGTIMSYEEAKEKLDPEVWKSLTEVIGYRIPTEDKYSMLPLKIMGFLPKAAGQAIMMPQEITYLTGSDFDIDKMYIMLKSFGVELKDTGKGTVNKLMGEYHGDKSMEDFQDRVRQLLSNAEKILKGDKSITLDYNVKTSDGFGNFVEWYRDRILSTSFTEYTDRKSTSPRKAREARNNRLLDLQWAVLTHEDTVSKMLNPGNFNEQKRVGRIIKIIKSKVINPDTGKMWTRNELQSLYERTVSRDGVDAAIGALDALLEGADPHSVTLPMSKIYFQRQNMQGTQMVGIFANNNVSHAFMTFQKVGIDLMKDEDKSFVFDGIAIGDTSTPSIIAVLDRQKGFNGQLISKTIASFLAASVDTAKDPTLADMNVNTFTGGIAMALARLGFDTEVIGLFLSQPIIMELSDLYFREKTDGYYSGTTAINALAEQLNMDTSSEGILRNPYEAGIQDRRTLTRENLLKHLADSDFMEEGADESKLEFQKQILVAFNSLFSIATDLQELTFCTKFNSVTNAVGPTIADTLEDQSRVERFQANTKSVFYVPENVSSEVDEDTGEVIVGKDANGFTNPADVILNDPILHAFYKTTIDEDGASQRIFRNFFPHYFKGFGNMLKYFKENFTKKGKVSSKLYNQLLDDYLYYLLTFEGKVGEREFLPTIPTDNRSKDRLVVELIDSFNQVASIRGRRPNLILDQTLAGSCLRVRKKDDYIGTDILVFEGGQMGTDMQEKIKRAWSDLITYSDPNLYDEQNDQIRRFGVDLFFYTLMRNGFGFNPRTLMHLASMIVKMGAKYDSARTGSKEYLGYIEGLRNIKAVDEALMGSSIDGMKHIRNFLDQFIRNHPNNRSLIPTLQYNDKRISVMGDTVTVSIPEKGKKSALHDVMVSEDTPQQYITVITKIGTKLFSDLYRLDDTGGKVQQTGTGLVIKYTKTSELGLVKNFIEYNANLGTDGTIMESYFEALRGVSGIEDESQEESDDTQRQAGDEVYEPQQEQQESMRSKLKHLDLPFLSGNSPQEKAYRKLLQESYKEAKRNKDNEVLGLFNDLLSSKEGSERAMAARKVNAKFKEQLAKAMDMDISKIEQEIERIFEEQNKCKKG